MSNVTLKMKFDTMSGSSTWSFKNAKQTATLANVRALAQAMIDNGSVYQKQPVRLTEAKVVTTTEQVYDLDS